MIYTITVKFEADRELKPKEVEALLGSIELQIQEPQTLDLEEAEYGTVVQQATIEKEGESEIMKCAICEKKKSKRVNLFSVTSKNKRVQACNVCITDNLLTGWSL